MNNDRHLDVITREVSYSTSETEDGRGKDRIIQDSSAVFLFDLNKKSFVKTEIKIDKALFPIDYE